MCWSNQAASAGVLILGILSGGCGGDDAAAAASARSDGIHEYRAVCTEKAMHGGTEYVLSKWLEIKDQALELGNYHGQFKEKGHRIRIDERVKPAKTTP
jgi:hypothetical protein